MHVDEIAGGGLEDSFGHMAAARISGAEDEDAGFHDRHDRCAINCVK